jgi:RNase P subunit RPR2
VKRIKIERIKRLHEKVIHEFKGIGETEEEYLLEDKEIAKIKSNDLLRLICPKCFPILPKRSKTPSRSYETYDITYPKINKIYWSVEEWNQTRK